jgi:hypothetical protein
MRRAAGVIAFLVGLAAGLGPAAAQPMMDPRQASGMPRPDTAQAVGTMSVRVLQGELAKPAPAGTVVHLVGLRADGGVEKQSRPVDAAGRATFEKLAADGSVAYYAFALLGEDRLESQLVVLDKMAGIRLMLAGRKTSPEGVPEGEAIDDAFDRDLPMRPPAGEVWVLVGGRAAGDVSVEVVRVPDAGQAVQAGWSGKATPSGGEGLMAKITGVTAAPDAVYVARVKGGTRWFYSKPFMMKADAGVTRTIITVDQAIVSGHFTFELDDEQLRVQTQYFVQNYGGAPMDLGKGIALPLPRGAEGGQVAEGSKAKIVPGKEITLGGVLPPGGSEILAGYHMPVDDGRVVFDMAAPYGLFNSTVIVEHVPGSTLTPPPGSTAQTVTADDGRQFDVIRNVQLRPGESLRFTLDGLPEHPYSGKLTRWAVGLVVAMLLLMALFVAVWSPATKPGGGAEAGKPADAKAAAARRKELTARRESLYAELVALERKKKHARIDDDDYKSTRQALVSRLTLVLRELDQLDA